MMLVSSKHAYASIMRNVAIWWDGTAGVFLNADWADPVDEIGSANDFVLIRAIHLIRPIRVQKESLPTHNRFVFVL